MGQVEAAFTQNEKLVAKGVATQIVARPQPNGNGT